MAAAIIGILSAIAIPNLMTAIQRSKQKRTMVSLRSVALAWEERASETARYNAAGIAGASVPVAASDLESALAPTYIKLMPLHDGWNDDLKFFADIAYGASQPAQKYVIVSAGRDGSFETTSPIGATYNFDCDIIYSNGNFLQWPATK
jgi:type II secretory pathway pseudopilin PulG